VKNRLLSLIFRWSVSVSKRFAWEASSMVATCCPTNFVGLVKRALVLMVLAAVAVLARSAHAQTFTVLFQFSGGDGEQPYGALVEGAAGNFYGTTLAGGSVGAGVVYKVTSGGKENVLHNFGSGSDGRSPQAGLVRDSTGNLYGTTQYGGAYNNGTIFRVSSTGTEKLLRSFFSSDAEKPLSTLVRDGSGNLYGTAFYGGAYGYGSVFKLAPNGQVTVLHSFNVGSPLDGQYPYGGLVRDSSGNLYGTTTQGGTYNTGVAFKVNATGKETILHSFGASKDGKTPTGDLVRDSSGDLYGTTRFGGLHSTGTVFKLNGAGGETILYNFGSMSGDGGEPEAGLIRDSAGNLYGTAVTGGPFGYGTVYKVTPGGKETLLHSFSGFDGASPSAVLLRDSSGSLYGTTSLGGLPGAGVVFKLTP
jgi:uncharacterized repeat protein (TIGR03803 family)